MQRDAALFNFITQRMAEPFAWGTHDCAMLVFDAVQACTGRDPAPDLRGAYSDAEGALKLLRGMRGLVGLCAERFGAEIPPGQAEDGDVALLDRRHAGGESAEQGGLGVFWRGMVAAQGEGRIVYVPRSAALRAWRAC